MAITAADLVGSRVLVVSKNGRYGEATVEERRVLELSPSGQWVRLMDQHGRKYWTRAAELQIIEVLATTTEPRPVTEAE